MPTPDSPNYYTADHDQMIQVFIDQHRTMLVSCLEGLSEQEARTNLVPSKTTLLGLVKHATFVERVWFGEAVSGLSRDKLGIVRTPEDSFVLTPEDNIQSISKGYWHAVELSRQAIEGMPDTQILTGNRRGPLSLAWVKLHVLREFAQHCGHADILREQILAQRA